MVFWCRTPWTIFVRGKTPICYDKWCKLCTFFCKKKMPFFKTSFSNSRAKFFRVHKYSFHPPISMVYQNVQTEKSMCATPFSDYLGQKHYSKQKFWNFHPCFPFAQALQKMEWKKLLGFRNMQEKLEKNIFWPPVFRFST